MRTTHSGGGRGWDRLMGWDDDLCCVPHMEAQVGRGLQVQRVLVAWRWEHGWIPRAMLPDSRNGPDWYTHFLCDLDRLGVRRLEHEARDEAEDEPACWQTSAVALTVLHAFHVISAGRVQAGGRGEEAEGGGHARRDAARQRVPEAAQGGGGGGVVWGSCTVRAWWQSEDADSQRELCSTWSGRFPEASDALPGGVPSAREAPQVMAAEEAALMELVRCH